MIKTKIVVLAIIIILPNLISGCGYRTAVQPPKDMEVTYPRTYPKPMDNYPEDEGC